MVTLFSASLFAATYTVAGDSEALFGEGKTWNPGETANDMTLVDGLYTFAKTDVTLPAGTIQFKVCQDHAWTTCWPSDNYKLAISTSGKYDITITFNESTKEVGAKADKKEDVVVLPSIAMHGNFTGSWTDTENFAVAEGNQTASLKLTLEAKNFEFGMRIGGSGNWTSNGSAFTRANNSHVINAGSGNLTLKADAAGEYTFTWTFATNTLEITFPESVGPIEPDPNFYITGDEALLGDKAWNPAAIAVMADSYTFENLAAGAYKLKVTLDGTWNDGKVKGFDDLTEKAEGLTADGDGNICFSLAEAGNVVVTYTATVFTVEGNFTPAEVVADGFYLVGSISNWAAVEANVFVANPESEGEYQLSITLAENDEFKAVYVENGAIKDWYPAEGGNYVVDADHAGECTVYFRPDGNGGADWFGGHLFVAKNGETAILNTMDAEKVVKMIENGQLIIIKNGVRYNAQGAVVR